MATKAAEGPSIYDLLAAEFEPSETFQDSRGGATFTYVTGEGVTSRLNKVLGPAGWTFKIREHGIHAEADEIWVLGSLEARIDGAMVVREQFGSQKVKRSRAAGTPLDIGFDLKGATTDALKKCATLIGVGLYLSHKESIKRGAAEGDRGNGNHGAGVPAGMAQAGAAGVAGGGSGAPGFDVRGEALACALCGEELKETRFGDGTIWTPAQLAGYGQRKHGQTLCMSHYRAANDAKKRGADMADDVAF
jgi:hypothetical protein